MIHCIESHENRENRELRQGAFQRGKCCHQRWSRPPGEFVPPARWEYESTAL